MKSKLFAIVSLGAAAFLFFTSHVEAESLGSQTDTANGFSMNSEGANLALAGQSWQPTASGTLSSFGWYVDSVITGSTFSLYGPFDNESSSESIKNTSSSLLLTSSSTIHSVTVGSYVLNSFTFNEVAVDASKFYWAQVSVPPQSGYQFRYSSVDRVAGSNWAHFSNIPPDWAYDIGKDWAYETNSSTFTILATSSFPATSSIGFQLDVTDFFTVNDLNATSALIGQSWQPTESATLTKFGWYASTSTAGLSFSIYGPFASEAVAESNKSGTSSFLLATSTSFTTSTVGSYYLSMFSFPGINVDSNKFYWVESGAPPQSGYTPRYSGIDRVSGSNWAHFSNLSPWSYDILRDWAYEAVSTHTCLSSTISSNTTVTSTRPVIVKGAVTINSGTTLTIPAGTTVKFLPNSSLVVNGTLSAQGTSTNFILIGSDDTLCN